MAVVHCVGLVRTYNVRSGHPIHALRGIELTVNRGEFAAVMGPSGSGKSTLLHVLGLLDQADAGTLHLNGHDVSTLPRRALPALRNKHIGFVFQRHHLLPTMTARDNVMLPLRYRAMPRGLARKEADHMLSAVGLADRLHHRPGQLSGGEQQRVAIARALVTRPLLVLADEPTGELDTETSEQLLAFMQEANERWQQTFVIVTHDHDVAKQCRRVVTLRDGRVVSDTGRD